MNRDNPQERIIQSPDLSSEEELDFLVLKPASPHKEARQQGVTVMPLNWPVLLSSGQGGSLEDIVSGSEEDHVQDSHTTDYKDNSRSTFQPFSPATARRPEGEERNATCPTINRLNVLFRPWN